jgi:hypothetical protein
VSEFNNRGISRQFTGADWKPVLVDGGDKGRLFGRLPDQPGPKYYAAMLHSPYGNELVEQFAEQAIEREQLGARGVADLLAVSFSSNDHVGHEVGPDSPEVRDMSIRTDRTLDRFFKFLDHRFGLASVLIVLTADHGVAPVPEVQTARRMPGGRVSEESLLKAVEAALVKKFGPGRWILDADYGTFYLDEALIREQGLKPADVQQTAARALERVPAVARAYTREQLLNGRFYADLIGRRVANGFHPTRSGDVLALLDPYWIYGDEGTSHGSAYNYDTHLPVIFMGPGIEPGRYDENIIVNDIAPTLATLLEVETPGGSSGRVLHRMILH